MIMQGDKNYRYMKMEGDKPYSLEDLSKKAFEEGVKLTFMKVDSKEAIKSNQTFPLLLVLEGDYGTHMVLLRKSRRKKFLIYDPAYGKKWIKEHELIAQWTGVFGQGEKMDYRECKEASPKIIHPRYTIASILCVVGSVLALFFGFYHLNEEGNFLSPVVYFAFYAVFEILRQSLAIREMKKFDEKYKHVLLSSKCTDINKDYKTFSLFKMHAFSSLINLVASCVAFVVLSILMGVNSPSFFLGVGVVASYQVISCFFIGKDIKNKVQAIGIKEEKMLSGNGDREASLDILFKDSYSVAEQFSFKKIIEIIICFFAALIPFSIDKVFSLNFYLFNFFSLYVIQASLKGVEDYFLNYREREMNKQSFLYLLNREE
ncbi:MAG: cysteine peptidase family C39 domain-containing protein [Bacilli bacterium]|nr:cysteine peptidase family C39 domain-containing protein [Bacilli bacterium]